MSGSEHIPRERHRLEGEFRSELRWSMFWPVLTLLVAAGLLVGLVLYVRDASWWVDHTDRVIGRATLVDRLVTDRQARLRGYLLTGTPSSLSAYVEADGHVLPGIEDLRQLVNDNSSQVEHLEALQPTLVRWHEYAREQLARRSEGATPNDVAFHLVDGDAIQADIQSRLREFVAVEEALRRTRVTRADAVTRAALGLGAVFALLAGPALAITTGRRMRRTRERYQAALETQEGTALSLQASDEMLRLAKDAADMGAWHWDIASGELVWSERCKELFGLRPETEMSYEVFLAAIHPDDRARVDRTVKATLASGTPYEIEMRVPWSDGSVHWIASKGEAFHADGRPVRMAGMAMDITARKTAEEALRRSETNLRQYAELVEYAPILVRNLGAEIVVWNEGMEKLYGWARGEVLGRVTHDVLCTRFPAPLADIMAILMREGRWEGELVHRHRDGSEMVVASVWTLHRDDDGRPAAVIEVSTDITALKRAEEALREADRRKDEFIGILSHELRNPLAPIRNSVQILHRVDPATPQAESARAIIARQVEHLARLVDDLLDVRRITTGKLRLHTAVMDLTEQVSETVEDLRPLFVTRSLSLDLQLPTRPVWVDGDRTRLGQLLGNLLHNAAKFTSAGGRVSVVVEAEERHAHIRVRDDGIGISPELRQALFDAFVQSDRTIHRTQGGLGLGLSLVRGIAELHGGSVVARSEGIGKGAEFVVTLSTTDPGPGVAAEPAATRTATRTRVLIIEDNLDAAESLRQVVEMLGGHEVEVAHDGVAGFDAARQLRPDVVLCDIGLPRMDGYEVARRLRASGLAPQPRLVAITGYAAADDVDRAMRAGFDYHVAKPPDIDQVLKLVADPPSSRPDIAVPAEIATGHQEVDAQHACILVAAARLRAAGPAGVREALRFLQQHASSHFEYEDKLMEDVGFPKVAAHKQQHASFLSQLRAFQEAVEREGRPGATPENLEALASTVEAWVNQHVLEQDRLVAEFLREQRPDQAAATGSRPRRLRLV